MTGVTFSGVTKSFGAVRALNALDLRIEPGEFVSLLGPSGSGKSTTLNLLAGLLDADGGEIRIGDRVVNDLSPDKRDIAMVFQNYALYPHMTVFENIAFPLRARARRVAENEIVAKVDKVAAALGVGELLARYPKELSGGQQQRVALGRAMVRDPKVFLLDEPLSNLDARLRIRMRHDIKALHQTIRSTIVYVTHDQAEAMSMSSRIAVFDKGSLQQYASPREIYAEPANLFVANFVGEREMTFLDGTLAPAGGDDLALNVGGVSLPLPGAKRRFAIAEGRRISLGARAEGVRVVAGSAPGAIAATVTLSELSGPDQIVYARIATGAELCCRVDPGTHVKPGDALYLAFVAETIHAFDPDTGAAIGRRGRSR
jgi:ABC-type sugar transport system ATPase subunit